MLSLHYAKSGELGQAQGPSRRLSQTWIPHEGGCILRLPWGLYHGTPKSLLGRELEALMHFYVNYPFCGTETRMCVIILIWEIRRVKLRQSFNHVPAIPREKAPESWSPQAPVQALFYLKFNTLQGKHNRVILPSVIRKMRPVAAEAYLLFSFFLLPTKIHLGKTSLSDAPRRFTSKDCPYLWRLNLNLSPDCCWGRSSGFKVRSSCWVPAERTQTSHDPFSRANDLCIKWEDLTFKSH